MIIVTQMISMGFISGDRDNSETILHSERGSPAFEAARHAPPFGERNTQKLLGSSFPVTCFLLLVGIGFSQKIFLF